MARYHYECEQCGADITVQISGPSKHRDQKLARARETRPLCEDCWRQQRDAEAAKAAREAKDANLPELEGTAKQVAWATTIRRDALAWIATQLRGGALRELAVTQTSASAWIDGYQDDRRSWRDIVLGWHNLDARTWAAGLRTDDELEVEDAIVRYAGTDTCGRCEDRARVVGIVRTLLVIRAALRGESVLAPMADNDDGDGWDMESLTATILATEAKATAVP